MMRLVSYLSLAVAVYGSSTNFLRETNVMAHNSYHVRQYTTFTTLLDEEEIDMFLPVHAYSWPSLSTLLDNGVCGFEFDVWPKEGDDDDFPIKHVHQYDETTTCKTLSQCLTEISEWMKINKKKGKKKKKKSCPINIELEIKLSSQSSAIDTYWSEQDFYEINKIVADSFKKDELYTPKKHGAKPSDQHWPGFDGKLKDKYVFLSINKEVIDRLYPNAVNVANKNDRNSYEYTFNLFTRCNTPLSSLSRYCVVFRDGIETDNYAYRGKYIFTKYVAPKFLQLSEYPFIPYNDDFVVKLPVSVTKDADHWINTFNLGSFGIPTSYVPYKLWNAWMTMATWDGMGNNNGIIDVDEVERIIYEISDRSDAIAAQTRAAFTTPDIWGLGIPLTLDGMYVNNPLAWLAVEKLLDSARNPEGKTILLPTVDLSGVITETCQAIEDGYTYIKSNYPYQTDEPYKNGNVWPFTIRDIDCSQQQIVQPLINPTQTIDILFVVFTVMLLILNIWMLCYCHYKRRQSNGYKHVKIEYPSESESDV